MKAYSHEKHAKKLWKNQKKSSDPWARSGERPGWGHGSELFVFFVFLFFHGFLQFGQNLEKTKKTKKTKSSDPWARSGERPGWGHSSELFVFFFVFFVFPWFFAIWPKLREKKTKSSDPWARSGERPGRGHGSDVFSIVFLHVFHVKMLSSQYLSKNARFYNLHTCAPMSTPSVFQYHHLPFSLAFSFFLGPGHATVLADLFSEAKDLQELIS